MTAYFSQPATAPGRETTTTAPAQPAQPAAHEAQPSAAPPSAPSSGSPPGMSWTLILIMALPLLLVVMTSRSQSKKQKKIEESLKVGDRVVTRAGLIGKLTEVGERTAKIEIAPGVTVQMLKASIEGVDAPPAAKAADAKDGAGDKESAKDRAQEKKA